MDWSDLPPPQDLSATPRDMFADLERHLGAREAALACAEFLEGAAPQSNPRVFAYLAGRALSGVLDGTWPPYWCRVWGARALRYVWTDEVAPAVTAGLADEAWRVAEMCVKVAGLREIGEAGPGVAALTDHDLPRVRVAAVRALGVIGDVEHVQVVETAQLDPESDVRRVAAAALARMVVRLDLSPY